VFCRFVLFNNFGVFALYYYNFYTMKIFSVQFARILLFYHITFAFYSIFYSIRAERANAASEKKKKK